MQVLRTDQAQDRGHNLVIEYGFEHEQVLGTPTKQQLPIGVRKEVEGLRPLSSHRLFVHGPKDLKVGWCQCGAHSNTCPVRFSDGAPVVRVHRLEQISVPEVPRDGLTR